MKHYSVSLKLVELLEEIENMSGWVNHRIRYLRNWRQHVEALTKSIEELLPNAEVYIIGVVAKDRLTILSDIDVLIVVNKPLTIQQHRKIRADIIWNAEKHGFPWDYPVEIHIITRNELPQHLKHVKKLIPVKTKPWTKPMKTSPLPVILSSLETIQ